jgi:N-glycosylase/DNA lyase
MCLLTTRQRSGPKSPVYQFLASKPFALKLATIRNKKHHAEFVAKVLKKSRGIQRYHTIGKEVAHNIPWFDGKGWKTLKARLDSLSHRRGYKPERETAKWIADNFAGLGPKQARNFLQALGLTRYEIPIDSRVTDWLRNDFQFALAVGSTALSDPDYYGFVNDAIREMCREVGTYACVLDAVLFSRVDNGAWEGIKPIF